jgi:hypothetical protein
VLVIQPFCHCPRNQDTTLWWAGLGESASLVTPSIELLSIDPGVVPKRGRTSRRSGATVHPLIEGS